MRILVVLTLITVILAACGWDDGTAASPDEVTVQLKWLHQVQFAGFYVAEAQGYYSEENIAVTFLEGGPQVELLSPVIDGTAHFGVAGGDTLLVARAEGKLVRAIAVIYRKNPMAFISLADSGITRPEDFAGQTIRLTLDAVPTFYAMMARVGISPDQYTISNAVDAQPFYAGDIQVTSAYLTGEVLRAHDAGYEVNIIYPDDYGIHFYADTLFASDRLISSNPELVTRFLQATLRGWRWAIENPEEAANLTLSYNPGNDETFEMAQMAASVPLVHTGEDQIGWMREEVWQGMHDILLEQEVIAEPVNLDEVYSMDFLEAIYGGNQQ